MKARSNNQSVNALAEIDQESLQIPKSSFDMHQDKRENVKLAENFSSHRL